MRAIVTVVLVLAVGAVGWLLLPGNQPSTPPTDRSSAATSGNDAAAADIDSERVDAAPVQPMAPDEAAAATHSEAADDEAAATDERASAPITLTLAVHDRVTRAPLPSFRWRFLQTGAALRGEVQQSRAELPLPGGAIGELLIEADGMQPFSQRELNIPTPPAVARHLDLFLIPNATATGITLWVADGARKPVEHVRVDAFAITDGNRDTSWQLGSSLWARRTSAPDGHYTLPTLPPGEFGIVLVATDADGALLPLLPYRRTFVLTGSNGFVEDVPLEPGCVLLLELLAPDGQPFEAGRRGVVTLDLSLAGAPPTRRLWTARTGDANDNPTATISAVDRVPANGVIWPAEALPAGTYTLVVNVDGQRRTEQPLLLRAGERQTERVTVY